LLTLPLIRSPSAAALLSALSFVNALAAAGVAVLAFGFAVAALGFAAARWKPPRGPGPPPRPAAAAGVFEPLLPGEVAPRCAGAPGAAPGGSAACVARPRVISASGSSASSTGGGGASGGILISRVTGVKPNICTVIVQTPSPRSGNRYTPCGSDAVTFLITSLSCPSDCLVAVTVAPGTG